MLKFKNGYLKKVPCGSLATQQKRVRVRAKHSKEKSMSAVFYSRPRLVCSTTLKKKIHVQSCLYFI